MKIILTRQRIVIVGIGIVLALFILMFGTLEITSQPLFCNSCHYMKSYYKEWKNSSHKKVNCLECHSKPGINNYLRRKFEAVHEVVSMMTGKYPPRPHAEVDDASCLRNGCHEKRLLNGKVNFKGVVFDHTPHLTQERRGRTLRCTSCHAQMAMGRHIAVTEETCFLCHFKDRMGTPEAATSAFCEKCHKVPDTAITIRGTKETFNHTDYLKGSVRCSDCHEGIVRGNGNVPEIMCSQCHNNPENIKRIKDIPFIHENHITKHKVECYLCHATIEHSIYPSQHSSIPSDASKCAQCHGNGHLASELLYRGQGAKGVPTVQNSMYRAHVTCTACHRITEQDTSFLSFGRHLPRADKTGCILCHGDDGSGYLADWKTQVNTALSGASAALARAEGILRNKPEARQILDDARYNISLVKEGIGVHNVEYAVSILEYTEKMLVKACATGK